MNTGSYITPLMKGRIIMYENNYNYIKTETVDPEIGNNNKNNKSKVGKIIASLLAVVVIGGASGCGGAYMYNKLAADDTVTASASSDKGKDSESAAETSAVSTADSNSSPTVSSLLSNNRDTVVYSTAEEIFNKVSPSVVCVHSEFDSGSGTGTGIVLSSDGYIITNAHVVETETTESVPSDNSSSSRGNGYNYFDPYEYFFGNSGWGSYQTETVVKKANKVTIILSDDDETEYEAEIIGTDTTSDLAVLKIDADGLEAAQFGDSDELSIGSEAYAIGYPMGLGLSITEGIISGLNRQLSVELTSGGSTSMTLIQTDTAINPGNSGGPLINKYGQVVGITSSKLSLTSVEGLGFAIPISEAMPLINDLMNQGYVEHHTPQFGITGSDINASIKRYYGLPVDSGVLVVSVEEGSGAADAGICEGDVIVAADGKTVEDMDDLTAAKNSKEVGDTVVLTLARKDGNIDVTVTLTEAVSEDNG